MPRRLLLARSMVRRGMARLEALALWCLGSIELVVSDVPIWLGMGTGCFPAAAVPGRVWLKAAGWSRLLRAAWSGVALMAACEGPGAGSPVTTATGGPMRTGVGPAMGTGMAAAHLRSRPRATLTRRPRGRTPGSPEGTAVRRGARRAAGAIAMRGFHRQSL